jgi:hypothetical protein
VARRDDLEQWDGEADQRVGWRWQWRLGRWGRYDGRQRKPDPLEIYSPFRTGVRRMLESRFHEVAERIGLHYSDQINEAQRVVRTLDMRIANLEDQLVKTASTLAGADARRLDSERSPERAKGDRDKSENVVRSRRRREFEKELAPIRKAHERLEEELRKCREEWVEQISLIDGLNDRMADEVHRVRAKFMYVEQIYLRALLKRHPEGDLLRAMLDESPYRLPEWMTRIDSDRTPAGSA